ncbi:unnamed protein product [Miscanthus lutarioriparius]|uniref:Uncharacterized protein n=1 Tax=Miscanthus lutarioriparius TaxID=422564 RepID=A0A811SL36_9POAL|nr:unnamed protein product [Miscanthus lutarioriparius]
MLLMFFLFGALSLVLASAFTAEFVPAVPLPLHHAHRAAGGLLPRPPSSSSSSRSASPPSSPAGALLPSRNASPRTSAPASVLIAVQGLWFYHTALALYGPMLPAGCARRFDGSPHSDARVECRGGGAAAQERAEQLADFQLFGIVFLAFVYVLGCFAVAAARYGNNLETSAVLTGPSLGLGASRTATPS